MKTLKTTLALFFAVAMMFNFYSCTESVTIETRSDNTLEQVLRNPETIQFLREGAQYHIMNLSYWSQENFNTNDVGQFTELCGETVNQDLNITYGDISTFDGTLELSLNCNPFPPVGTYASSGVDKTTHPGMILNGNSTASGTIALSESLKNVLVSTDNSYVRNGQDDLKFTRQDLPVFFTKTTFDVAEEISITVRDEQFLPIDPIVNSGKISYQLGINAQMEVTDIANADSMISGDITFTGANKGVISFLGDNYDVDFTNPNKPVVTIK